MRPAAHRAVELDPNLADAHAALAGLKFDDWDWAGTEAEYRRALELNPDSVDCGCYANALAAFGRFKEALEVIEHIQSVNPLSSDLQFNYGFVLYVARKYGDAEAHLLRAIELEPRNVAAHAILASTYLQLGRLQDALAQADRPPLPASGQLVAAYARLGRRAEALKAVDSIPRTNPYSIAMGYLAMGDKDRSLEWLTKSVDQHQGFVRWVKVWPEFDDLHSDPRFQAIVARLKLPA
jgi:tetratricopeptide (TPR) repeat protein